MYVRTYSRPKVQAWEKAFYCTKYVQAWEKEGILSSNVRIDFESHAQY
jgi:hypothetical protein